MSPPELANGNSVDPVRYCPTVNLFKGNKMRPEDWIALVIMVVGFPVLFIIIVMTMKSQMEGKGPPK